MGINAGILALQEPTTDDGTCAMVRQMLLES
jgi:hypothetical protein